MFNESISFLASLMIVISCIFCGKADAAEATTDYSKVRIREFPVAMQCWTFHKFTFMETLDKVKAMGIKYLEAFPGQKLGAGFGETGFGPDMTKEQIGAVKKALSQRGITLVNFGVVSLGDNESSMRKVFDFAKTMGVRTIVTEPEIDDYSPIDKLVKEYNIKIAIHNHPDPNKYARPETVLSHIKGMDPRIGDCADTGHWMRTGVVPVEALRLLSGRIIDVHLKDLNEFGKKDAYDVPFGSGKANVHDILAELTLQDYRGFIVIEHENQAELDNPAPSIMKGLKNIDSLTYYKGYEEILKWTPDGFNMHGWNHYGPGYFTLDNKTGVLESFGGMGLLWYSVRKYGNFVLELDYKCQSSSTNSGIFIRVPEMLSSDDYIYHSFEIQIDDSQKGIWRTGGVYDAEAPKMDAFNPAGQWNHYKIMFVGGKITVELNGKITADWNAEPRGKIRDFAKEGYIGLQNHDDSSHVFFKNVFVKAL